MEVQSTEKKEEKGQQNRCPNCGDPMVHSEGCRLCPNCGLSDC